MHSSRADNGLVQVWRLEGNDSMFWIVLKKELLSFFRDRNTIIYSIVLPIALYPVIFWVMNELMSLHYGSLQQMSSRIAFCGTVPDDLVLSIMKSDMDIELADRTIDPSDPGILKLKNLDLDAVMRFSHNEGKSKIEVLFDSSSDRSNATKKRIETILDDYHVDKVNQFADRTPDDQIEIRLLDVDLASRESRSRFLLGILLPMIVVIITVMGGIYPSIEVITSERERKTIETTLVSPISATPLILGKYAAVITMSILAAALNIVAMILTLRYTLFGGASHDLDFTLPISALPMMGLGIILIAATFNALMILIAAFAKDFKEAQSYVSPVYAIGIQPAVVAAIPGIPFNSLTALIPVTNVSLFFRSLIQGNFDMLPSAITLGSMLLWCTVMLIIARWFMRRDALVMGLDKQFFKSLMKSFRFRKGDHRD